MMYPSPEKVLDDLKSLKNTMKSANSQLLCQVMRAKYRAFLPKADCAPNEWESSFVRTDKLAVLLLPHDIPDGLEPKMVTGDGNCLFNSVSVLLVGNEKLSFILRLLAAIELYLHADFYARHPKFTETLTSLSDSALFAISLSHDVPDTRNREKVLRGEAIATCSPSHWSGLMQVLALSSVLGRCIFSVYPNVYQDGIRKLLHGKIYPRKGGADKDGCGVLYVMWSRDSNLDNTPGARFQPNHFVPLRCGVTINQPNAVPSFNFNLNETEFPPLQKPRRRDNKTDFERKFSSSSGQRKRQGEPSGCAHPNKFSKPSSSSLPHVKVSQKCPEGVGNGEKEVSRKRISPFPLLSKNFFRRRARIDSEESEKEKGTVPLPFPELSKTWYRRQGNTTETSDVPPEPLLGKATEISSIPLPFRELPKSWYRRRGVLAAKNESRGKPVQAVSAGTLAESIKALERKIEKAKQGSNVAELNVVLQVARYLSEKGMASAKELERFYRSTKEEITTKKSSTRIKPCVLFNRLAKHLSIQKVTFHGATYILQATKSGCQEIFNQLENFSKEQLVQGILNEHLEKKLSSLFSSALKFADTKKDRDLIKGLFARATSVSFVTKLMDVRNKSPVAHARDALEHNVNKFEDIMATSRVVRNDMTNEQQRRLTQRIIDRRKREDFKLDWDARGRLLKADVFPELGQTLELIFDNGTDGENGGVEAHPRLTSDLLFKSKDNTLFMYQARELLLKVAPPGFSISLSSCYNYTNTYKEHSYAAKRHHHGKGVNANLCLRRPPRTNVSKHVVNLHWSTKAVNLLLEKAEEAPDDNLVDSKDSKTIIPGDIQPVQLPGKSWKPITYEDHTFDQSRRNAVYPVTHLFMDLDKENTRTIDGEERIGVRRTGKPASLIYVAISENETTFRMMNEIFYMVQLPLFDSVFRNPVTGSLKSHFSFIVDNGHAEDPDSPLTRMCLARIFKLLKLSSISQRSFAEYHSKRNFVERVHAAENEALSRHGAFNSKSINQDAEPGLSKQHMENMEAMAEDVRGCIEQAKFGGHFITCVRGVTKASMLFNDESKLKEFLLLSEERKLDCDWSYEVGNNQVYECLIDAWGLPRCFEGSYREDYINISNPATSWKDKYGTTIHQENGVEQLQPVPDYVELLSSNGEMHYLSFLKTVATCADVPEIADNPELFLPTRILRLFYVIDADPTADIVRQLSLLSFIPEADVSTYFVDMRRKDDKDYQNDILREKWKKHHLYKLSNAELIAKCRERGIHSVKGQKHELIRQIVSAEEGKQPEDYVVEYSGDLSSVPSSLTNLKKMNTSSLKYILRTHGISIHGNKDELVLRLFLLRHERRHLISYKEENAILETVKVAQKLIFEQVKEKVLGIHDVRRTRTFHSSKIKTGKSVNLLEDVQSVDTLGLLFEPLIEYINTLRRARQKTKTPTSGISTTDSSLGNNNDDYETFFEVGQRVKIKWTNDEIGDSGWRPGWYIAEVQASSLLDDEITVIYITEPECTYSVGVTRLLAEGKLLLG